MTWPIMRVQHRCWLAGEAIVFYTIEEFQVEVDRLLEKHGETRELLEIAQHLAWCRDVYCHRDPVNIRLCMEPLEKHGLR